MPPAGARRPRRSRPVTAGAFRHSRSGGACRPRHLPRRRPRARARHRKVRRHSSTAQRRRKPQSSRRDDEAPIIPILARKVREVEAKAQRGKLGPTNRVKFQVIAFLVREERARVKADTTLADSARSELLKRLDGVATILAKTAARDTSLIQLLEVDQAASPVARRMRRDWLIESGAELAPDELIITDVAPATTGVVPAALAQRQVVPPTIESRQMANPFLAPDLAARGPRETPRRRLDGWELMGPLYKAFETGAGGGQASMDLPPIPEFDRLSPKGLEIMVHQSRFLESVRDGHRTFLLADEPGLGKTAESVLAASVADAYPLLAVVPNVVKMNWAREVERWTPQRRATVISGDGEHVDAFADVFIVNYEILDRHLSWLSSIGLKGLVVDEAHFIKNLGSQRSQNVLALAARIREQVRNPLLLALTGTPLINDVEDFDAIWRFLGWTTGEKPGPAPDGAARRDGSDARRQGLLSRSARRRDLDGDRAPQEEGCRRRPSRQAHRRPAGRAGRRIRALDPSGRARARLTPGRSLPSHHRRARRPRARARRGRPRHRAPGRAERARRVEGRRHRLRERLHDGAQDRSGEGSARGGLRGAAAALGRQGRLLREAHRRDGCRRGALRLGRPSDRLDARRPDDAGAPAGDRRLQQRPGRRDRGLLAHRGRCRREHAGRLERRARRAVVDGRRADAGDRPRAPHRSGRAGHRVAHHRRAHDRHEDRRADRLEAGARRSARSTAKPSTRSRATPCSCPRSCTWCGRRSARTDRPPGRPVAASARRRAVASSRGRPLVWPVADSDANVGGGSVADSPLPTARITA